MGICDGRVVIVTGAGRGLGRAHALAFAAEGARLVVNDLGVELDGTGGGSGPAGEVVEEIRSGGGEAIVNGADVADWAQAKGLIDAALAEFGRLDVVVNNAGVVRDRMFVNATEDEFDLVTRVHLKGHFAVARHAAAHWRDRAKAGENNEARIINTSSGAGLQGSVGQAVYAASKGAIATLTLIQAVELARYGVTSNAICPNARTRMTEQAFAEDMKAAGEAEFDEVAPENASPLVVWLGSPESRDVTGRIFEVKGGRIAVSDGWRDDAEVDKGARWAPEEVGAAVHEILSKAPTPQKCYGS
jgi:NAD(P)-dependent dehydrogenase (short-subunit alcohol dehydrogenase family)